MNLPWLLFSPFLAPEQGQVSRPQVIHVWNDTELLRADADNIFLCPKQSVSFFREASGWPATDLYVDARRCQRGRDVWNSNGDRLACVAKVTGVTTELLADIGLDDFLLDGSLLGWFRHKGGQIPWDLDGDTAVLRSQCEEVVGQSQGQAICDILREKLPHGYFLYAIDEDEVVHPDPRGSDFAGCDVPELRIGSTVNGQWCHTDIYMASDVDDEICFREEVCFRRDQVLPLRNESLVGRYPVKIPAQPEEVLSGLYKHHSGIINMHEVPMNYAFQDDWAVVIGAELDDSFSDRVISQERVPKAPLDQLYLCPQDVVSQALDGVDWPYQPVSIDRSACMNHDDLLAFHLWGSPSEHRNRLMCIQRTTGAATRALGAVGVDAFLLAGSLLGWQRHDGGQIPWDTDGDTGFVQSQCEVVMKGHPEAANIASLIMPFVPDGFEVKYLSEAGLSDHPEDEFTGCDFKQLRITSVYEEQSCFTDIYLVSDEDVSECDCPEGSANDACIRAVPTVCPERSSLLPVMKSRLNSEVSVNVPHNWTDVLEAYYGAMPGGTDILNLRPVPKNLAFGDSHAVVVGELMDDDVTSSRSPSMRLSSLAIESFLVLLLVLICIVLFLRRRWHRRNTARVPRE
ncbi:hypothetical protein FOZ63_028628 [Perkinsus olseni]|uniref:LicD/FKTN/FKRP nucleotidyltransferase domain-containing protein n=1 Tax=Perkinsus olseni TaxID=32597 RepID=A0A7J6QEH2_PEROL|nr:hypothetical protein FOZ63_028628 [Perkinsus olseni]